MSPTPLDIVLWGGGGHALVVAETLADCPQYRLAGILVDPAWQRTITPSLLPRLLGGREELPALMRRGITCAFVAVGDNASRLSLAKELNRAGFRLVTIIAPSAWVSSSATLGPGTLIQPRAVVNAATRIGSHVIINTGIGPESHFLIILTSCVAALCWSGLVLGILRLWHHFSK